MADPYEQYAEGNPTPTATTTDPYEQYAEPQYSAPQAFAMGAGQGLTVGLGNKAQALGAMIRSNYERGANPFSWDPGFYQNAVLQGQQANQQAMQQNPVSYVGGNIVGGAPAAMLGGTSIPAIALQGATQGAGQYSPTWGQFAQNTGAGALIGGTLGSIGKGIGAGYNAITQPFQNMGQNAFVKQITNTLEPLIKDYTPSPLINALTKNPYLNTPAKLEQFIETNPEQQSMLVSNPLEQTIGLGTPSDVLGAIKIKNGIDPNTSLSSVQGQPGFDWISKPIDLNGSVVKKTAQHVNDTVQTLVSGQPFPETGTGYSYGAFPSTVSNIMSPWMNQSTLGGAFAQHMPGLRQAAITGLGKATVPALVGGSWGGWPGAVAGGIAGEVGAMAPEMASTVGDYLKAKAARQFLAPTIGGQMGSALGQIGQGVVVNVNPALTRGLTDIFNQNYGNIQTSNQ